MTIFDKKTEAQEIQEAHAKVEGRTAWPQDSMKLWAEGMGQRQWRGSRVAAQNIYQALELGLPVTAVMFYPPGSSEPVELQAYSHKVKVKVTFPDKRKFWKQYRQDMPKGGAMSPEEESAAVKSKKLILESFDLFMASQKLRLNRSSRAAIETLKTAVIEDAGAVVVMYVPKDPDEYIEYQCYAFETNIKITFAD